MNTIEKLMTDLVLAEACGDQSRAIAIAKTINSMKRRNANEAAQ